MICCRYNGSLLGQTLGLTMATRELECIERRAQMSEQPSHNSSSTYIHNHVNQWQTASFPFQMRRRRAFCSRHSFGPHKTSQSTYLTSDQIFSILWESQGTEGFPEQQTQDLDLIQSQCTTLCCGSEEKDVIYLDVLNIWVCLFFFGLRMTITQLKHISLQIIHYIIHLSL